MLAVDNINKEKSKYMKRQRPYRFKRNFLLRLVEISPMFHEAIIA